MKHIRRRYERVGAHYSLRGRYGRAVNGRAFVGLLALIPVSTKADAVSFGAPTPDDDVGTNQSAFLTIVVLCKPLLVERFHLVVADIYQARQWFYQCWWIDAASPCESPTCSAAQILLRKQSPGLVILGVPSRISTVLPRGRCRDNGAPGREGKGEKGERCCYAL